MSTIKKGYRLTVESWENDGDNDNTVILDGLEESKVKFLVEICKRLSSNYHFSNEENHQFGNMYDPSDSELNEFYDYMRPILVKYNKDVEDDEDYLGEVLDDLGLSSIDFFTRICQRFIVEYVPQDIEIEDVTHKFI